MALNILIKLFYKAGVNNFKTYQLYLIIRKTYKLCYLYIIESFIQYNTMYSVCMC